MFFSCVVFPTIITFWSLYRSCRTALMLAYISGIVWKNHSDIQPQDFPRVGVCRLYLPSTDSYLIGSCMTGSVQSQWGEVVWLHLIFPAIILVHQDKCCILIMDLQDKGTIKVIILTLVVSRTTKAVLIHEEASLPSVLDPLQSAHLWPNNSTVCRSRGSYEANTMVQLKVNKKRDILKCSRNVSIFGS